MASFILAASTIFASIEAAAVRSSMPHRQSSPGRPASSPNLTTPPVANPHAIMKKLPENLRAHVNSFNRPAPVAGPLKSAVNTVAAGKPAVGLRQNAAAATAGISRAEYDKGGASMNRARKFGNSMNLAALG